MFLIIRIIKVTESTNLSQISSTITQSIKLSFTESILILLFSLFAGLVIRNLYKRYALTFSSPENYGNTLLLTTICVASLIAVVKSSLALSLGLVGALSVIRFRTAVKEPYTLSFILLSVCLGISIGAAQYQFMLLLLVFASFCVVLVNKQSIQIKSRTNKFQDIDTLSLSTKDLKTLFDVIHKLSEECDAINIRNLNSIKDVECIANVSIKVKSIDKLQKIIDFVGKDPNVKSISFYNSPI